MDFDRISKSEPINLIKTYDEYIYNDGEQWTEDRQPVGVEEFYNNEYQEIISDN